VELQTIPARLDAVRRRVAAAAAAAGRDPATVRLLAVSKTRPPADLREAHGAGQLAFGESYVQEALDKQSALRGLPLEWHFIGRIQSNKTSAIARHFQWVHGLGDLKHARRLGAQRPGDLPPLDVCLQVNIDAESTKGGVAPAGLGPLAAALADLPRLRLRGLMAIPAPAADPQQQREAFRRVRGLYEALKAAGLPLDTLSMGMSGDLEAAIAEGATIVRIGTAIFGPRA
jgi:pyridoxal phosphate enzyme (YggS family)